MGRVGLRDIGPNMVQKGSALGARQGNDVEEFLLELQTIQNFTDFQPGDRLVYGTMGLVQYALTAS